MDETEIIVFQTKDEAMAYVRNILRERLRDDLRQARTVPELATTLRRLHDEWHGRKIVVKIAAGQQKKNVWLFFDGVYLYWREDGGESMQWPAVSGRNGFQSRYNQSEKGKGPLPEGTWIVRQSQYQSIQDIPFSQRLYGLVGQGTWPGLEYSWGEDRIWLEPASTTETYGRSGFSIHGGAEPGSAGCIDLTSHMGEFVKMFRQHGGDLTLTVSYPAK